MRSDPRLERTQKCGIVIVQLHRGNSENLVDCQSEVIRASLIAWTQLSCRSIDGSRCRIMQRALKIVTADQGGYLAPARLGEQTNAPRAEIVNNPGH